MQYLRFGNTDMNVSRLCLGTMTFSRTVDFALAETIVGDALGAGVNFIDTAESYGDSEEFLGRILQGKRDKVFLTTKVYTPRADNGKAPRNSPANIRVSLDRSLQLLRTDRIDLYQLHHPDPDTPIDETMQCVSDLVRAGKIRYVGVANHYAWQMAYMIARAEARGWPKIVSIQCRHNILDRVVEMETVPMAQRFGLALMAYAPLCGGMLTGKYHRGETKQSGTRSADDVKLQKLLSNERAFDVIERLQTIAARNDLALNQLAILWLMSKPHVTNPILGGTRREHFTLIYTVADKRLSTEDIKEIDDASRPFVHRDFENQPVRQGAPL